MKCQKISKKNIRKYKITFLFASFRAKTVQTSSRGTYCYKLHGQTYHSTSTLQPPDGKERVYILLREPKL